MKIPEPTWFRDFFIYIIPSLKNVGGRLGRSFDTPVESIKKYVSFGGSSIVFRILF